MKIRPSDEKRKMTGPAGTVPGLKPRDEMPDRCHLQSSATNAWSGGGAAAMSKVLSHEMP